MTWGLFFFSLLLFPILFFFSSLRSISCRYIIASIPEVSFPSPENRERKCFSEHVLVFGVADRDHPPRRTFTSVWDANLEKRRRNKRDKYQSLWRPISPSFAIRRKSQQAEADRGCELMNFSARQAENPGLPRIFFFFFFFTGLDIRFGKDFVSLEFSRPFWTDRGNKSRP